MYIATNSVVLKPGREVHARNRHPWVFLGAVASFPEYANGDILPVTDATGNFLGYGYFHSGQSIVGRMISFDTTDPLDTIALNIRRAIELRTAVIPPNTNAYRLINGEGDFLPGLIVDAYDKILVVQINTLGMEKLKPLILETLGAAFQPKAIYEKSSTSTRHKEGLPEAAHWLLGQVENPVQTTENGLRFFVDIIEGQKTGFFLDQRNMRNLVRDYARNRSVLNCFAYTGGFSVYALAGGARRADSVDTDKKAAELTRRNLAQNGYTTEKSNVFTEDVFTFLEKASSSDYDFIILDPPAFAKRASDIPNASRGYRELNRLGLQRLPAGGLLLTSSCSAHIDKQAFQTIVFQAAKDAKRNVKILSHHLLAPDHPLSIYYPEGDYLKSLLLWVE